MRIILTAVLFLAGLFNLFLGVSFLLDPARLGAAFNLSPVGPGGLAVLRADMTAFFLVAGGCQLWGGWRRNGDLLLVPALLFGIASPAARSAPHWMARPPVLPCRWQSRRCKWCWPSQPGACCRTTRSAKSRTDQADFAPRQSDASARGAKASPRNMTGATTAPQ